MASRPMLTEECGLNPHLTARGIDVVDTDLGERIVQLAGEAPSHLILPAVHKTRREIGALFHRRMGTPEDMVGAAVFLASADADYIVAQTLNVDGGNWMS